MLGRNQAVDKRQQVAHGRHLGQFGFLGKLGYDVQRVELGFEQRQALALARQHHHIARLQRSARYLSGQPLRSLAALEHFARLLLHMAGLGERVAPSRRGVCRRAGCIFVDAWQAQHAPHTGGVRGVGAKAHKIALGLQWRENRVDGVQHGGGIAPGVVAAQAVAVQSFADKVFGLFKHLRFGPPKPINALLGIAHDKHTGRTAGPGVARNPGLQGFPLQRVGVLKFINQ